jgi:predicted phosphodiesterase
MELEKQMKLHIMSDLHLEFFKHTESYPTIPVNDADVIILAGDIHKGNKGVYWARDKWPTQTIIYVPGNHEYYGTQRAETLSLLYIAGKQCNVNVLDNNELILPGVRFLGTTLWTDFKLYGDGVTKQMAMNVGQRSLNDFRVIHEGARGHFSAEHSIEMHEKSVDWLTSKIDEPFEGKTVVVTHHLPSMSSVAVKYKNDPVTACFASNLERLFGIPNLFIHGHTHVSCDYVENCTRVICNPRGYESYGGIENPEFNHSLVVEL